MQVIKKGFTFTFVLSIERKTKTMKQQKKCTFANCGKNAVIIMENNWKKGTFTCCCKDHAPAWAINKEAAAKNPFYTVKFA